MAETLSTGIRIRIPVLWTQSTAFSTDRKPSADPCPLKVCRQADGE
jgi:hypothetical protein